MTDLLEKIKQPEVRKYLVMGVLVALVFAFLTYSGEDTSERRRASKPDATESVFGLTESTEMIEQQEISVLMDTVKKDLNEKDRALSERERKQKAELDKVRESLDSTQNELFELKNMIRQLAKGGNRPIDAGQATAGGQARLAGDNTPLDVAPGQEGILYRQQTQVVTKEPMVFDNDVIRTITQRKVREVTESGKVEVRDVQTNTISGNTQQIDDQTARAKSKAEQNNAKVNDEDGGEYTLAMGSIISGTTLNGVAAPTGVQSTSEPIPVMMRIKQEALMPNHFTLDIRECHMLGSAVGNLSSERVYIRAEGISCITEDGQAIEKNITAYAVSSYDGMAGVKGDVVSRTGSMIASTMMASFLSGFGEAAAPRQVQAVNTAPQVDTLWQSQNLSTYAGSGILNGASSSAERLANYYMSMVEQTYPVVELLPGTQIDFLVQKGMTMKLDGNGMVGG
ncbi:TrbI/VirB10 family protein [Alteromonas gilva]|uniref:TrbI/VirB10 family protein n=1 Tax=Alteromonas gilva TaxID=2987522 RepID=A0ABT5L8K7_9ALTE|nr:TrbI/VirB10 family protein [Alteromonas gilva]MDC8832839.1 TrbI/VirB10 family protein [Alteromonas gilva]